MTGHLRLKWNNHSTAFLKNINIIQSKERFCDSTIVCQGKYFPVHRIILSTCSDYFDEIFERIQCQHPYIVFKDIDPGEMELLLNYMYQGEVNVVQEKLPTLIRAAEALKIKGLAVPDDLSTSKESSSSKKRSSTDGTSATQQKNKRRHNNSHSESSVEADNIDDSRANQQTDVIEEKFIKQEPEDTYRVNTVDDSIPPVAPEDQGGSDNNFVSLSTPLGDKSFVKSEGRDLNEDMSNIYDDQSSSWNDFSSGGDILENIQSSELIGNDENMRSMNEEFESLISLHLENSADSSEANSQENSIYPRSVHQCPYCPYNAVIKSSVRTHIMFKHTKEKPYSCSICHASFATTCNLHRHNLVHTGEKPFACPHCEKKFTQEANLKKHLQNKTKCY